MFSIIVATDTNNIIGKDNKLLWNMPNDLKRFKEITTNHIILMGRKTFQSLPKVLPNRYHIVLTKNESFTINDENVEVVHSLDTILERYLYSTDEIFVIGGGEIYKLLLPYVSKVYLTRINNKFIGDTYFPILDCNVWKENSNTFIPKNNENIYDSEFIIYSKE